MKRLLIATTALTLLIAPISEALAQSWNNDRYDNNRPSATVQHRDNDRRDNDRRDGYRSDNDRRDGYRADNGRHRGWYKGGRIERRDWNRGYRVSDYSRYRLNRPPRGYEWRRVDDNYVLAAVATGLIASVILASQANQHNQYNQYNQNHR